MTTRRKKIEEMLQAEPDDVFLRYSLAMELSGEGEVEQALEIFSQLCKSNPPHVPAFFRSAQLLAEQEKWPASRDFLRNGIEVARQQNDLHAAAEMSEMLAEMGMQGE